METKELIGKLATVGCALYDETALSAHTLAQFTEACRIGFDLEHKDLIALTQTMIDKCMGKLRLV